MGSLRRLAAAMVVAWTAGWSAAFAADPGAPRAACLPEGVAASGSWPVLVVYLHGWFAAAGPDDVRGTRALERANRAYLTQLALRNRIRIAVPLGPQINPSNGMVEWGDADLSTIERSAMQACRVTRLPDRVSVVGFSNGGFKARDLGQLPCGDLMRYGRIVAVGTQAAFPDRCDGKFRNVPEHRFPPDRLADLLALRAPDPRTLQEAASDAAE
jgi:hypothetical protein